MRSNSIPVAVTREPVGGIPAYSPGGCPASRPAGRHHIPFGYLVLDDEAGVWVGCTARGDVSSDALTAVHLLREAEIVQGVVGGE